MNADILKLLRAADPATHMPQTTPEDRDQLRRAIIQTPVKSRPPFRGRFAHPRLVLAALVGGGILLLGGSALAATIWLTPPPLEPRDSSVSWQQVRIDYVAWTHKLQLPPGATWYGFKPPSDNSRTSAGAGAQLAINQAIGEWAKECIAAGVSGDAQRVGVATTWLARLRTLMRSDAGLTENQSGYDQSLLDQLDAAIASAREGHFAALRYFVPWANWGHYDVTPKPMPSPAYPVGWTMTTDPPMDQVIASKADIVSAEQMRADYRALLSSVGLPAGVSFGDPTQGSESQREMSEGFTNAFDDAWNAWWSEWVAAAKVHDSERISAAAAASSYLLGLLPHTLSRPGVTMTIFLDPASLRTFRQLDAQAREGDMRGITAWLAYQQAYRERIRQAGQ